jgi:zinc transport system ATP-binding protein
MNNKIIIELKNIYYISNNLLILDNVSLNIKKNQTNIFIGPNGAGKTTLLKIMYGLLRETKGCIIRNISKNSCFIFQTPNFLNRSVYENLSHALYCKNILKNNRHDIIIDRAKLYNFNHLLHKNVNELSGGELQLLSLMRALIFDPDFIFYDEPSNNLDAYHFDFIIEIIKNLSNSNKNLFLVSHDERLLNNISGNIIHLNEGRII